jgi:TonB family protein
LKLRVETADIRDRDEENLILNRVTLSLAISFAALVRAQPAMEIIAPQNADVLRPGDTVTVEAHTTRGLDALLFIGDGALNAISARLPGAPPYRFTFRIPADAPAGLYHMSAMGVQRGQGVDYFAQVTIDVEPVWPEADLGSQTMTGTPGVTINTHKVPLLERSDIGYPPEAIQNGAGGTVVMQVTPNSQGRVEGVEILSGPEELRKTAVKGVLTWRFPAKAGMKPRPVEVTFDPVEAQRAAAFQSATQPEPRAVVALPAPTEGIAPQRIRVAGADQAAKLLSKVDPVYPPLAKVAHIQGVVRFSAVLSVDGRVEMVQVLAGHPLLVPAAQEAVKQWTYSQTTVNGRAVEVATQIEVEFFLTN